MTFKKILLIILTVIVFASCGIEVNYPVLTPPGEAGASSADGYFYFSMLESNDETEFRGFELYYKFYDSSSDGSVQLNNESNLKTIDDMASYEYKRITRYNSEGDADTKNDSSYPLIKIDPVDRGIYNKITINFRVLANPYVEGAVVENNKLGIRRAILEPDDSIFFKSFDDVDPNDEDLAKLDNITGNVVLSMYVFSFGRKDASTRLYSEAVHLSSIQISF